MVTSIATMPAGPELDALVRDAIGPLVPWSTENDIGETLPSINDHSAMNALKRWREKHPEWTGGIALPRESDPNYRVELWKIYPDGFPADPIEAEAPTLALAISRAIAMAAEVQG